MSSKSVSVELESENLLWLEAETTRSGRSDLSETLNEVLVHARTGGRAVRARSVRGTIRLPESDPTLERAAGKVRRSVKRSLDRTARLLADTDGSNT